MDGAAEQRAAGTFEFEGFVIPEDLAILTGWGPRHAGEHLACAHGCL